MSNPRVGGYKVPKPKSEGEEALALGLKVYGIPFERERYLISGRKFRTDFWIYHPIGSLAIEIDGGVWTGGRHGTGKGITRDCEKLNLLTLAGYRSLRFTTSMVMDGTAIDTILKAMG